MTLKEYQAQSLNTLIDKGEVLNKAHMVIGLMSEINELIDALHAQDLVNIHEEYADEMWFISGLATMYGIDISERKIVFIDELDILTKIYYLSKLADLVKRDIIYGKEVDIAKLTEVIHIIVEFNVKMFEKKSWDFEQALQNNSDKLRIRAEGKKIAEASKDRDLEAERKELEK